MKNTFDEIIKEIEETNDAFLNTKSAEEQLREIKKTIEFHYYDIKVTDNILLAVQEVINREYEFKTKYRKLWTEITIYLEYDVRESCAEGKNISDELNKIIDKIDGDKFIKNKELREI